jgi:hypothetical protein
MLRSNAPSSPLWLSLFPCPLRAVLTSVFVKSPLTSHTLPMCPSPPSSPSSPKSHLLWIAWCATCGLARGFEAPIIKVLPRGQRGCCEVEREPWISKRVDRRAHCPIFPSLPRPFLLLSKPVFQPVSASAQNSDRSSVFVPSPAVTSGGVKLLSLLSDPLLRPHAESESQASALFPSQIDSRTFNSQTEFTCGMIAEWRRLATGVASASLTVAPDQPRARRTRRMAKEASVGHRCRWSPRRVAIKTRPRPSGSDGKWAVMLWADVFFFCVNFLSLPRLCAPCIARLGTRVGGVYPPYRGRFGGAMGQLSRCIPRRARSAQRQGVSRFVAPLWRRRLALVFLPLMGGDSIYI